MHMHMQLDLMLFAYEYIELPLCIPYLSVRICVYICSSACSLLRITPQS